MLLKIDTKEVCSKKKKNKRKKNFNIEKNNKVIIVSVHLQMLMDRKVDDLSKAELMNVKKEFLNLNLFQSTPI